MELIEVSLSDSIELTFQEFITELLEKHREEAAFIGMVDKKKKTRIQKRLLVIGRNRIMSVKPGAGKVTEYE
jgi:hypothetical protein